MKRAEPLTTIPVALAELRDAGREPAYFDEIGRQVSLHDKTYMKRRDIFRRCLGFIGINIPELPSDFVHPGPGKMYPALRALEVQGTIVGEFEEAREDGAPSRRMYQLVEPTVEPKV